MTKITHSYVGQLPCGCGVALVIDDPDHPKDTAKDVAEFIAQGHVVQRMEHAAAVEAFSAKCPTYPHTDWQIRNEAARRRRELAKVGKTGLLVAVAALLLTGCMHDALESGKAGNDVTVEKLFTHDGVTVYRFSDGGYAHYYAVPSSGVRASAFSAWDESCGTNCTQHVTDEVPTMARR
jgi:hypothetical protein